MFEGFSFDSPSWRQKNAALSLDNNNGDDDDHDLTIQCSSSHVSPLSSRCPSPGLIPPSSRRPSWFNTSSKAHSRSQFPPQHRGPAPTSMPPSYAHPQQHRLSIGSLTHRLNAHTLENGAESGRNNSTNGGDMGGVEENGSRCPITPRSSPAVSDDLDMSTADTPTIMDPLTPPDTDRDEDVTCLGGPSPTSSPRLPSSPSPSLSHPGYSGDSSALETVPEIRHQREALSILQSTTSTVGDTVRLATLLSDSDRLRFDDTYAEDGAHPSSLPPSRSSRRQSRRSPPPSSAPASSSSSSSNPQSSSKLGPTSRKSSRVDKSHYYANTSSSSSNPGCASDNASLFSGQGVGLRRKSLVLAAVSAVLEKEAAAQQPQSPNGLLSPRTSPEAQPRPGRRRSHASPRKSRVTGR